MIEALLVLISFLGLIVGITLALIAPEELKDGRKYFVWVKFVLLLLIIGISVFFSMNYYLAIPIIIAAGLFFYKREYMFLPAFAAFVKDANGLFILYSLLFLYGLPVGSLTKEKTFWATAKKLLMRHIAYIAVGIAAIVIKNYI